MVKRTQKKEKRGNVINWKPVCGVLLLAFGLFLFITLVFYIGNEEKDYLGKFFGKSFPHFFVHIFGKFSATLASVSTICWGIWMLAKGEFKLKICVGISAFSLLIPAMFALLTVDGVSKTVNSEAFHSTGGLLGYFFVESLIKPVFGAGNVAIPFFVLCLLALIFSVVFFGLRPSHFSFVKVPLSAIVGWWKSRPKVERPLPEDKPSEISPKAEKRKEPHRASIPNPDWDSDYTVYTGKAKPFRGAVGVFDGTLPVSQEPFLPQKKEDASEVSKEVSSVFPNAAEREIEEKERYLKENENRLGALEVRALRDEIAHLRQVQQMNDWENNRQFRPSIQGIVERRDGEADAPSHDSEEVPVNAEHSQPKEPSPAQEELPKTVSPPTQYDEYIVPKVADILDAPPAQKPDYTAAELDEISHQLEEQLENFKVKGKVLGISTGPMITRFEVEPGPGVKVSRFAALHEDLALALKAKSIRILAPIPGKSLVGVEVPNRKLQTVYCRDIFESPLFKPQPDKLIIALGKDITGNPYTMDLCRAPHILIAGQTGSGKSVCINTLMASLLFSKTPDELRMILVDPKVVELKLYENIPHLLSPVVTQPDAAVSALKWACVEMDRRYEKLADWKVRNLVGYNQKRKEQQELVQKSMAAKNAYESAKAAAEKVEAANREALEKAKEEGAEAPELLPVPPVPDPAEIPPMPSELMENMPYIVVVIDELADLMMVAGKEVEKYIARIAQKARAVGIHLVIATQRPSVNVITGLIKANLPARISFKVASQIDSRTVMDRAGAEKLLGRGDMLYRSGDDPEPIRVHGGFLTDEEVEKLSDACANQNVHYDRLDTFEVDDPSEAGEEESGKYSGKMDPIALDVARYGLECGSLSTSGVQRHFSVGFSRAGKIMDILERLGICGPKCGSKPREMLIHDENALFEKWPS